MKAQNRLSLRVAIVGGGATGFFAAFSVKEHHKDAKVVIFEKSNKILAKVKISGGGRCNVTNACFSASVCTLMQKVWERQLLIYERIFGFFRVSLFHESLQNYFKTNFLLMQEHKYSLTEIENWMPWERSVYISMLIQHLKKKADKMKQG